MYYMCVCMEATASATILSFFGLSKLASACVRLSAKCTADYASGLHFMCLSDSTDVYCHTRNMEIASMLIHIAFPIA